MDTMKFRVLEIILQNRHANFDTKRVALMSGLPEMSWEEIASFIALLGKEGYLNNLYGDNEVQAIAVQPDALARLYDARETSKSDKAKEVIDRILKLAPAIAKVVS